MKKIILLSLLIFLNSSVFAQLNSSQTEPVLKIGDGTTQDLEIKYDIGSGVNNPYIKLDSASGKLKFKNVSGSEKNLGSGSGDGGSGGINGFISDFNPNAEDATAQWTVSGGVFTTTALDPLEGDRSFEWTPSSQGDYIESALLDFNKDNFRGKSCEYSIYYVGGDENLSMKIIDGAGSELSSEELKAHGISASESGFLLCPNEETITGDSNKGNLKLRIENTGASASPLIKFDLSYVGTLRGLVETTLPDVLSGVVAGAAGTIITGPNGVTSSKLGTGRYQLNWSSLGLTVNPVLHVTMEAAGTLWQCQSADTPSPTGGIVECFNNSGNISDKNFMFSIIKQGADAKQSVQVYKSIPKIADNINHFSAFIGSSGAFNLNVPNWISCTPSSAPITCNFDPSIFSVEPNCQMTVQDGSSLRAPTIISVSTTQIQTNTFSTSTNNGSTVSFRLNCMKAGSDFKMPTVQPIIVGQVTNSSAQTGSKNVAVEGCDVFNNGTASILNNSGTCSGFIASVSRPSIGFINMTMEADAFSGTPSCTCTSVNTGGDFRCNLTALNSSLIQAFTVNSAGSPSDVTVAVTCVGER